MKKVITTLMLLFLICTSVFSQKEIIHEKVGDYDYFKTQKFAVNGTHFVYNYMAIDFFTPSIYGQQIDVKYRESLSFTYGLKYKLRVFNWLATGLDINYNIQSYRLKKSFMYSPLANENVSEKLSFGDIGSEYYLRFNIGKHGNSMGNYFDFGVFGYYNLSNKHIVDIKNTNSIVFLSEDQSITNKKLSYISKFHYGGVLRIGFDKYAIVAKYRISDIFTSDFMQTMNYTDLPRLSIGFEFGMF